MTPIKPAPHRPVVLGRIVGRGRQAERLGGQPAHRRKQREGRHDPAAPRQDQRLARVQELLLRVEHVERRALADPLLLLHAGQRDLGRLDAFVGGDDRALGGVHLRPGGDDRRAHLVARDIDLDLPQPVLLLRLPDARIDRAARKERDGNAPDDRRGIRIEARVEAFVVLDGALERLTVGSSSPSICFTTKACASA